MFRPIGSSPSAAERCAEAIREQIISGQLAPGSKLPSERDLATRLGVNRLTLRAALAELRAAGLVKVKHGSGYTVEPYLETSGPGLLPALVRNSTATERETLCADLLLLRRHLAAAALSKLAAKPALETSAIGDAIGEFVRLAKAGASVDELAAADVRIVASILEATGSQAFRLILNPLTRALDEVPELRDVMYENPIENARGYESFTAWLDNPSAVAIDLLIELLEARDRRTLSALHRYLS